MMRFASIFTFTFVLAACTSSQNDGAGGEGATSASGPSANGTTSGNGSPSGTSGTSNGSATGTTTNTTGSNTGSTSSGVPIGPEPSGTYGLDGHNVVALPAGIGFDDEDYGPLLHVVPPATWAHAPGEAFDGRDAVRFFPRGLVEGAVGPRELHFEESMPGLTQLNVRWLAKYSRVAHQAFPRNKQAIIVRTSDPLDLGGTGRSISMWQPDPVHDGMAIGPCDGIVCSYIGADPPYWPDGSDTFWIGPPETGGRAEEWVSFEQEYVTDHPRTLTGSPASTITTIGGTHTVEVAGAQFTQDIQPYDTLLIESGPDATRYIVQEVLSDTQLRVERAPVGFDNDGPLAGGTGTYRFATAYSKLYVHTRDGQFVGEHHTVPQWDTGAFGTIAYLDIVGGYLGTIADRGDEGWFMLDRLRIDTTYIGPPDGFVQ